MKIVIRHGILSSAPNMAALESYLKGAFPMATIDNRSYPWRDSILVNGVRLAADLVATARKHGSEGRLMLVGHSMGGLVCRVANCALSDPSFRMQVTRHAIGLSSSDCATIESADLTAGTVQICAVVTLATPNSGAMTYGQISALGLLASAAGSLTFRSPGIEELRTDRLFRVLQHCNTTTPCFSISGSWGNRFGATAGRTAHRHLARWSTGLREPNDAIVEDASVDLSESILPHEFNPSPRHVRRYADCTDVTHTSIHCNAEVLRQVATFLTDAAAQCEGAAAAADTDAGQVTVDIGGVRRSNTARELIELSVEERSVLRRLALRGQSRYRSLGQLAQELSIEPEHLAPILTALHRHGIVSPLFRRSGEHATSSGFGGHRAVWYLPSAEELVHSGVILDSTL